MTESIGMTWSDFQKDMENFALLAERIGDDWSIFRKNDGEGNSFLMYKQKIPSSNTMAADNAIDMLQIEYHIVYSVSYQVPMMLFQIHKDDGSRLSLEQVWEFFCCNTDGDQRQRADMLNILTQMEHPVLFAPYLALHPCRTSAILAQTPASQNRVLTFISLIGPCLRLHLSNAYGHEETCSKGNQ